VSGESKGECPAMPAAPERQALFGSDLPTRDLNLIDLVVKSKGNFQ